MCIIEITHDITFDIIYDVGDGTSPLDAEFMDFEAGRELDVDIYDTDRQAVCIQFAGGEIVLGVPVDCFRIVSRCPRCVDP